MKSMGSLKKVSKWAMTIIKSPNCYEKSIGTYFEMQTVPGSNVEHHFPDEHQQRLITV